jgi:hypothetical protein
MAAEEELGRMVLLVMRKHRVVAARGGGALLAVKVGQV